MYIYYLVIKLRTDTYKMGRHRNAASRIALTLNLIKRKTNEVAVAICEVGRELSVGQLPDT